MFYSAVSLPLGDFLLSGETNPGFTSSNMLITKVGQHGEVLWTRSYGAAGADVAYAIGVLSDGSYIAAGCQAANNLILLGLDSDGDSLWSRTYSSGGATCIHDLVVRNDGIVAAVGTGIGADGIHTDILFALYDPNADTLYVQTYGSNATEIGLKIDLRADNGFTLGGSTGGFGSQDVNIWIVELDSNGAMMSSSVIPHAGVDACHDITQFNSDFVMCGRTTVSNQNRGLVVKTNSAFDTLWTREFADSNSEIQLTGVTTLGSSGVITAGWHGASWNSRQCWIASLSDSGSINWTWLHGTYGSGFYGIVASESGGFLAFGQLVVGNSRRAYAARLFLSRVVGTVIDEANSEPVTGVRVSLSGQPNHVFTDSQGEFSLTAANGVHDLYVEKHCFSKDTLEDVSVPLDDIQFVDVSLKRPDLEISRSSLNVFSHEHEPIFIPLTIYNSGDGYLDLVISSVSTIPEGNWLSTEPESGLVATGDSLVIQVHVSPDFDITETPELMGGVMLYSNACPRDTLEIPVFVTLLDVEGAPSIIPKYYSLSSFPNPFNTNTFVRFDLPRPAVVDLTIYSITGQRVRTLLSDARPSGRHEIQFDAGGFSSGLYFVKLSTQDHVQVAKMVLVK